MSDLIDRRAAIDALWKALYEYEDKTEKQFQESDELDISEWILHRIFVQNMSDIDRQTILKLPSADAVEVVRCKYCENFTPGKDEWGNCCENPIKMWRETDFCSFAERKENGSDL